MLLFLVLIGLIIFSDMMSRNTSCEMKNKPTQKVVSTKYKESNNLSHLKSNIGLGNIFGCE